MWTILLAEILCLFCSCNASRQIQISEDTSTDTVLLYRTDSMVITNIVPAVLSCQFSKNKEQQYNSRLKTLLLLENVELVNPPEGVYELYITDQPPGINSPLSRKGFVTVLDLYSLTAPNANSSLEIDISEAIKKLFSIKQSLSTVYISIRFGPIKLPDGSYSSKAGELRITGIRIAQTDH